MKKFVLRIFIFIIINIIAYNIGIYLLYGQSFLTSACNNPREENYDLVIMGTSHGQVFRNNVTEKVLTEKIKVLATGAAGVIPQKISLTCFFEADNKTKEIIYLIDPWILYSRRWNEDNYILQQEGIEYSYFAKLLENNISTKVIFNYFRDKLIDNYDKFTRESLAPKPIAPKEELKAKPEPVIAKNENVPEVEYSADQALKRMEAMAEKTLEEQKTSNQAEDKQRLEILFNEGTSEKNLIKYSRHLEEIILISKNNKANIIFIIPPTFMGKMPGHDQTIKLLAEYKKKYKTEYYDYSVIMQDPTFYWDREHLTEAGVEYFTKNYLKEIINKNIPY